MIGTHEIFYAKEADLLKNLNSTFFPINALFVLDIGFFVMSKFAYQKTTSKLHKL